MQKFKYIQEITGKLCSKRPGHEEKDETNDAKSSQRFVRFVLVVSEHVAAKATQKARIKKTAAPSRRRVVSLGVETLQRLSADANLALE